MRLARVLRRAHESGNLYFGLAAVGSLTYAALTLREDRDVAAKTTILHEVQNLRRDQERTLRDKKAQATFSGTEPLYAMRVARRVAPVVGFDGPAALPQVALGQRVLILEEHCGPDHAYHQCRNDFGEGLYLAAYLVKDEPR